MRLAIIKRPHVIDNVFSALVASLIWFPPFALGAVHPWPAAIVEVLAFLLVIMTAIKLASMPVRRTELLDQPRDSAFVSILIFGPILLLATFVLIQLLPLPPAVIHAVSASTYNIYAHSLSGWPRQEPYAAANYAGASIPATWLPLSLSPSLTVSAMLRLAAYGGLLFSIFYYPFDIGPSGEKHFHRIVITTALLTGFLAASVGLLEKAYWNGKILWLFVPWDWKTAVPGRLARAMGPFVDPDHFGNYLAMIFPVALVIALRGFPFAAKSKTRAIQVAAGTVAFIIVVGILLSLCRAAWIEIIISSVILLLFCGRNLPAGVGAAGHPARERNPLETRTKTPARPQAREYRGGVVYSAKLNGRATAPLIVLLAAMALAFYIIGPRNRIDSTARVAEAMTGNWIGVRPAVWKASLRMAADFPLFGVGLASWPEIYPHYATPPWNSYYFREAHNDYIQYLDETGVIGAALLACLLGGLALNLWRALRDAPENEQPLLLAFLLAGGTMVLHESVDFCLHVPANAILLIIFIAIALRIRYVAPAAIVSDSDARLSCFVSLLIIAAAAILSLVALTQSGLAYPYNIGKLTTSGRIRDAIVRHPASAAGHIGFLSTSANLSQETREREIAIAIWLDPANPWIRDTAASIDAAAGRSANALREITISVRDSPALSTHFYLAQSVLPWLTPSEQGAVKQGFVEAMARHYDGSVDNLGSFYDELGDFTDESGLYFEAAENSNSSSKRAECLSKAARAEISAANLVAAESLLRQIVELVPNDTDAYIELVEKVLGPEKKLGDATDIVNRGRGTGADPVRLDLALSNAAESAGDQVLAEKSLLKAMRIDPSFQILMRAGQFYLERGRPDRAAPILANATEVNSSSAEAFYLLGVAEERDYQYSRADEAYAQAALLAPSQFKPGYAAFRRRIGYVKANS